MSPRAVQIGKLSEMSAEIYLEIGPVAHKLGRELRPGLTLKVLFQGELQRAPF